MKYTITPKFRTREIVNDAITKHWMYFQNEALNMGRKLHAYMQNYINTHRRRRGGSGRLAKAVTFDILATAPARLHWGIGNINVLNRIASYWYVVNYGKTTSGQRYVPNYGNFVPGWFRGGDNRPDAKQRGKGKDSFQYAPRSAWGGIYPKSAIRPMNYIQATVTKYNIQLKTLLMKLRSMK